MTNHFHFVVLGTGGTFTYHFLNTLVKQHYLPLAYIQSGNIPRKNQTTFTNIELEVNRPAPLNHLLKTQNIPTHYQSQTHISGMLHQLKAEFLVVACWPELLSGNIIQSVSKAALNLHPSLLPKYRGVDPIGYQLKEQDNNFGVSLHLLNNKFDTGDIVLQQASEINQHSEKAKIKIETAKQGAGLFIRAINTYEKPGWNLTKQVPE